MTNIVTKSLSAYAVTWRVWVSIQPWSRVLSLSSIISIRRSSIVTSITAFPGVWYILVLWSQWNSYHAKWHRRWLSERLTLLRTFGYGHIAWKLGVGIGGVRICSCNLPVSIEGHIAWKIVFAFCASETNLMQSTYVAHMLGIYVCKATGVFQEYKIWLSQTLQ